jgi:hypothetical protein
MPDRLEPAASGRAGCRACGLKLDKGALRFGEELPNAYGEGDATSVYWFHPRCAAHRRPEVFARFLRANEAAELPDRAALLSEADQGIAHPRLPRLAGIERARSGRAACRRCKQPIPSGAWRFRLSTFESTGFFEPLGFIHVTCAPEYFGVADTALLRERLRAAAPDVAPSDVDEVLAEIDAELSAQATSGAG